MHGIVTSSRAKKSFGQHFLHDATVIARILSVVASKTPEVRVEIGPGRGALTRGLYDAYLHDSERERLMLVELDDDLIPTLREDFPDAKILHEDAARVDWKVATEGKTWQIVSNLPYNAGTAILSRALWSDHPPMHVVVMLQKEVAERMLATPKDMSLLSIVVQLKMDVERVCLVKPGAFSPPPKVDSLVIELREHHRYSVDDAQDVLRLAKLGFAFPRKQVCQTLSRQGQGTAELFQSILVTRGLPKTARPEELSLDDWHELVKAMHT